jgi:Zn-dependent protease/CBS domain-containing protein
MKWSWKIFTAFGIGVYIHATFWLLILWVALQAGSFTRGLTASLLVLAVFACVVFHEFGHALTALRFGIRTRDITILPIGGLARLERIPTEPRQELLIALAGPPVNLVLAAVLYLVDLSVGSDWFDRLLPGSEIFTSVSFGKSSFIGQLMWINVSIAVFNLVPAFPMDGGRILRSLLAIRLDYLKATRIAVTVGQALAFVFGLLGFLSMNPMLLLVAFFVYLGAAQEGAMAHYRQSFQGLPTSIAMITQFNTLEEEDRLEKAVEFLLHGSQVDFPVVRDGQVVGLLTRSMLIDSLGKKGAQATIRSVSVRPVKPLQDDLPLDRAYETLQQEAVPCLPVLRRGQLVGLVTMENLAEFAMVTSALRVRNGGSLNSFGPG